MAVCFYQDKFVCKVGQSEAERETRLERFIVWGHDSTCHHVTSTLTVPLRYVVMDQNAVKKVFPTESSSADAENLFENW